jgi:hypothetical protein
MRSLTVLVVLPAALLAAAGCTPTTKHAWARLDAFFAKRLRGG